MSGAEVAAKTDRPSRPWGHLHNQGPYALQALQLMGKPSDGAWAMDRPRPAPLSGRYGRAGTIDTNRAAAPVRGCQATVLRRRLRGLQGPPDPHGRRGRGKVMIGLVFAVSSVSSTDLDPVAFHPGAMAMTPVRVRARVRVRRVRLTRAGSHRHRAGCFVDAAAGCVGPSRVCR